MASSSSSESTVEEMRNWLELPPEVMATILQRLGAVNILTVAQTVCTTWRNICKDPAMWRTIDMQNSIDYPDMEYALEKIAKHAIDRSCGQLIDINIGYYCTDELLQYITDRTSYLRRLQLVCCYNISDEGFSEAAKKLPLLEELHLYDCSLSKEAIGTVGRCCPLLRSFKFNNHRFSRPQIGSDEEALAIAENMPELRHLQLFGNKITNNGLEAILDGCPHLESLDLRHCLKISLEGNMGKRLHEQIKDLRRPSDSIADYEFDSQIHDDDSFDDENPSEFSDIDVLSDDDEYYEFSGASDFSDYEGLAFD
ncbi:hypothetical protein F0562_013702 [Nyssa sinensis]|uniref:F-box domain-containing protein n=1 Tax=Nyssa sinensis TaxID=561372 RepID=A0A5J4ZKS6_9ASTE|nr:hypothetical protein F0562_013702 [Nyssa sinensis]